jgi:hypothetical protein
LNYAKKLKFLSKNLRIGYYININNKTPHFINDINTDINYIYKKTNDNNIIYIYNNNNNNNIGNNFFLNINYIINYGSIENIKEKIS